MAYYVFVPSFCFLYNQLSVIDHVETGYKEAYEHVQKSVDVVTNKVASKRIPEHAANECTDDATQEEETAALAIDSHSTEAAEHDACVNESLTDNHWFKFGNGVNERT